MMNDKLTTVLKKNSGFQNNGEEFKVFEEGEININNRFPEDFNANNITCMKYDSIITANVEQSFQCIQFNSEIFRKFM